MPNLVFILVGSVVSVNLCAKNRTKERKFVRKGEIMQILRTSFFNDSEFASERDTDVTLF